MAGFAAVALLSLVLAYWTWVWFAPRPQAGMQLMQTGAGVDAAYGLFGKAQQGGEAIAPTGIAIRLLGIVAATAGYAGYAVVQLDTKEIRAVQEGDEISPGIRLDTVSIDHIILERGGTREMLTWPEKNTATAPVAP